MRQGRPRSEPNISPDVSVVIPVVERYGDLEQIYNEFAAELARLGRTAEFLFVVDEQLRDAVPALRRIQARTPQTTQEVLIILLGGPFGASAALTTGLTRARGERVVTLASYFQVEPSGLGPALQALDEGADLVVGRRYPRIDSRFNRIQSRLFHGIVHRLTGTDFHDVSCGFKVMKKRVARDLNLYGGLHRFIPLLALHRGFAVREIPVPQRQEDRPMRYHGTGTYLGRLLDILNIFFLTKFTRTPLRFFGLLGAGLFSLGFLIDLVVAVEKVFFATGLSDRALLLLGVLLMVLGVQTLSLGLVGEIIIFTHARNAREYKVAEIIRSPQRPELSQAS
ncbi:MAG TPA: glycosyltransferase [Thermoanaerobaculia bacterium]|jgi:glycosyltransferase involved in cell wall biosynthesis|nr:glycosyltransferase [Thermoanaerobaculia bacterium]